MSDEQLSPQNPEESQQGDEHQTQHAEEQARIAKLEAETLLVRAQLRQTRRENAVAAREARSWGMSGIRVIYFRDMHSVMECP